METSVAVASRLFPSGADVVYLANSEVFADAVSSVPVTDGPILLVPPCGPLPLVLREAIARLGPSEVVALGGTGAVCDATFRAAVAAAEEEPQAQCPTAVTFEYSDADIRENELGAPLPPNGDLRGYTEPVAAYLQQLADDYDRRDETEAGSPDYGTTAAALRSLEYRSATATQQEWRSPDGQQAGYLDSQADRLVLTEIEYPDTC